VTTTTPSPAATAPPLATGKRAIADRTFRSLSLACGLGVLVVLALIAIFTTKEAWPAFQHEGLRFFTSRTWDPNHTKVVNGQTVADPRFGALAFIYGTLVVSTIALVISLPVSIGLALYLSEVAPRRLRSPVSLGIDLLAAVPSVVYGLWGVLVLVPVLGRQYARVSRDTKGVPVIGTLFSGNGGGKSFLTAGLILALMITPIITSLSREVFDTVPRAQKEAALALGATRWEMIRGAIFPWSGPGVTGAVMLGLGRAMGETIAVALVIGSSPQITAHLFGSGDALPSVIANQFGEASSLERSALIGLGVVVFVLTILVNSGARVLVNRGVAAGASA
jgi:phosphate transport system permease protein